MAQHLLVFAVAILYVSAQNISLCGQYPTCEICIENNPCGWCSVPVVYDDGSTGPHCAGKPADPNNPPPGYKPWVCPLDFQNQACYGYVCNELFQCVSSGVPGGGVPLSQCMETCIPPTFECNQTSWQCYQVTPGHGTDKQTCEDQCHMITPTPVPQGYYCDPNSLTCMPGNGVPKIDCELTCGVPNNVTPVFAIGDWRGLEISHGYMKGEWQMKVTADSAVIVNSVGSVWSKGKIETMNNELWLVTDQGHYRGIYGLEQLPEVQTLTWGLGSLNGSVPSSFNDAMASGTTFIWSKCLNTNNCLFHIFNSFQKFNALSNNVNNQISKKREVSQIDDPCQKYPDCHTCIAAPENCGWCSVPVLYNNTIVGSNCAGVNTTISPRINCTGTFSTVDCNPITTTSITTTTTTTSTTGAPTAQNYYCDPINNQCIQAANGTLPYDVCNAECTMVPIVPPVLQQKYFRGLEIDMTYTQGEWRVYFGTQNATIVPPAGFPIFASVGTVSQYLVLTFSDGSKVISLWQIQQAPATVLLSWAWGAPNANPPASFDESMNTQGEKEFWFAACLDGTPSSVCDFTQ
eukprot:TRINITY_DN245_c0_g1_i1.p1 TRINITY_DN245_c0_g1~~TRINITY_DN245_c0_g1_i1.p1  ORF type:complete len:575 (+),score=120.32 TRINITY_DN245_c0_g1_i1:85-1809(+)